MDTSYSPLPTVSVNGESAATPTDVEVRMMQRSARWVIFLCFVQLLMALGAMLFSGIFFMVLTIIFASLGITGARKQHVRFLTAHFIFSLVLYILSLVGMVALIIYCNCSWIVYVLGFFLVLFQAVGLRHSRNLIVMVKKFGPNPTCNNVATPTPQPEPVQETPAPPVQPPVQTPAPAFYPIALPMQQLPPQYIPMQPMRYPMMQQPMMFPQFIQPPQVPAQQSSTQPPVYPVLYRQM
jgi:hypothetical protein